jgi:uncharacterized Zn finger protein
MPIGQPTPKYKFRLLCKRCNSYMHTAIEVRGHTPLLACKACGTSADDLDAAFQSETNGDRIIDDAQS